MEIELNSVELKLDDWKFYFRKVDDRICHISFDTSLITRLSEIKFKYSNLTIVQIPFQSSVNGLAIGEEADRLDEMADLIESSVAKPNASFWQRVFGGKQGTEIIHAGHATFSGIRQLFLYSKRAIESDVFREVNQKFPQNPFKTMALSDPEWIEYRSKLLPSPLTLIQLIMDWMQLAMREKAGDDLTAPRDVDHNFLFKDEASRRKLLKLVKAEEFKTNLFKVNQSEVADGLIYGLTLTKRHRIDRMWSDIYTVQLCAYAEETGGKYDGWGAPEVRK